MWNRRQKNLSISLSRGVPLFWWTLKRWSLFLLIFGEDLSFELTLRMNFSFFMNAIIVISRSVQLIVGFSNILQVEALVYFSGSEIIFQQIFESFINISSGIISYSFKKSFRTLKGGILMAPGRASEGDTRLVRKGQIRLVLLVIWNNIILRQWHNSKKIPRNQ